MVSGIELVMSQIEHSFKYDSAHSSSHLEVAHSAGQDRIINRFPFHFSELLGNYGVHYVLY